MPTIYNYNREEFMSYLNRHLTGILLLKNHIHKITVYYSLENPFSNYSCRFFIKEKFKNLTGLSEKEEEMANRYLYNYPGTTGNEFVSFIYRSHASKEFDIKMVKLFISCYEFAQSVCCGFLKTVLPEGCDLEVTPLEDEPFFMYASSFLRRCPEEEPHNFDKEYYKHFKRHFEFDHAFHRKLKDASSEYTFKENSISETHLYEKTRTDKESFRRYLVNSRVHFSIPTYLDTIDDLLIDRDSLKNALLCNAPDNSYTDIHPKDLLAYLKHKEAGDNNLKTIQEKILNSTDINIGDYIYVKDPWTSTHRIGIVKDKSIALDQVEITYNTLKKNCTESKRPAKRSELKDIQYYIPGKVAEKEINEGRATNEQNFIPLFKNKGHKNRDYKPGKNSKQRG